GGRSGRRPDRTRRASARPPAPSLRATSRCPSHLPRGTRPARRSSAADAARRAVARTRPGTVPNPLRRWRLAPRRRRRTPLSPHSASSDLPPLHLAEQPSQLSEQLACRPGRWVQPPPFCEPCPYPFGDVWPHVLASAVAVLDPAAVEVRPM